MHPSTIHPLIPLFFFFLQAFIHGWMEIRLVTLFLSSSPLNLLDPWKSIKKTQVKTSPAWAIFIISKTVKKENLFPYAAAIFRRRSMMFMPNACLREKEIGENYFPLEGKLLWAVTQGFLLMTRSFVS